MNNELKTAIELGKTIAPYCFFANFLEEYDPKRGYTEDKIRFYIDARQYIKENPDTELARVLTYRGRIWRLSYDEPHYDNGIPVSWAYSDWMFRDFETREGLTKVVSDTKEDFGVSVEGLAKYLQTKGLDIHDVEYWTGITADKFFEENPSADQIGAFWDSEEEILYPVIMENILSMEIIE